MKKILFVLFYSLSSITHAADPWTRQQYIQEGVFDALLVIDAQQTKRIEEDPRFFEKNRFIGNHASNGRINRYFLGYAVSHAVVSYLLPNPWRDYWQWLYIGYEAGVVTKNYELGVHVTF